MDYRFAEIVDIPSLQRLMENLWRASGIPVGIIDPDGTVLVATGWQPICTEFHRRHPEALKRCQESDAYIGGCIERGEGPEEGGYVEYLCRNGLVDVAVPILIDGRHLANLFLGQFLYATPEEEYFRTQARRYGFAEEAYLEALRAVPIFTREKVREILDFYASFVHLLSRLGSEGLQRRRAEEAQRESVEKFHLLFSAVSDAILLYDAETLDIAEANEAAALLYGYDRAAFSGLNVADIAADPVATRTRIREALARPVTRIPLSHHRRRDGSVFPVEISHGTLEWKGRQMCVGVVRDISERQQAMRMKDEMLSAVSHEIRTPLTAILGFAEYLRDQEVEPGQAREYLDIIAREGERLKELTDNLLDLQRLRAGFGTENFQPVPVPPLLSSVVHLYSQTSPCHRLHLDCPPELPPLWGDERQLRRALQNLLANAIKYSPAGGDVRLGARQEGAFLTLWVKDDGIGIPAEAQEQIFENFFRLNHRDGQKIGGTGLGLALVKAVVQVHRGQVWVESAVGAGSRFLLSLPVLAGA